jgi:hypothetical protein
MTETFLAETISQLPPIADASTAWLPADPALNMGPTGRVSAPQVAALAIAPLSVLTIAALRSLTALPAGAAVNVAGYFTPGDPGGGIFVYVATDTTSADNGGTIVVDAGGHRWYRSGPQQNSVNNFGGFPTTADCHAAIAACLAATGSAYFPVVRGSGVYSSSATVQLASGQFLVGDGAGLSFIRCTAAASPTVALQAQIFGFSIKGLSLIHSGTPTAGGDGLFQPQGVTFWVNDGIIQDVACNGNWIGFNLGVAFYCQGIDLEANFNLAGGYKFTTGGNATVPSGATSGPLQWYLTDIIASSNGGDGISFHVSGVPFATSGTSVGTLTDAKTFANTGRGVGAYGAPNHPIQGIRMVDGFYGDDANSEIYLDTYGGDHVLTATFCENAGQGNTGPTGAVAPSGVGCGIEITANNIDVTIHPGKINANSYEGVLSAATTLVLDGGIVSNNGAAGAGGRGSGISITAGGAIICGVRAGNVAAGNSGAPVTGTSQIYGISSTVDELAVTGCDLRGNTTAPTNLTGGTVNSQLVGNLPVAANVFGAPTITGGVKVTGGLGVGVAAPATGVVNVSTAVQLNGAPYTNP